MTTNINVTTPYLPIVGQSQILYMTVILNVNQNNNSIHLCNITNVQKLYGNVSINNNLYTPLDNNSCALIVIGEYNNIVYSTIYYNNAIINQQLPDNRISFIQKLPKGIFQDTSNNSIIGNIATAYSQMIDDYYKQYFFTISQVFGTSYSSNLEFEYNSTSGLLSNSAFSNELFLLFSQNKQYGLNIYDLELFISQYIYFRLGSTEQVPYYAVYIQDGVSFGSGTWILGDSEYSTLGSTTILGSDNQGKPQNITWTIYGLHNNLDFQSEVTNIIYRMTRVDIGNTIIFSEYNNPINGHDIFTTSFNTFQTDTRTNSVRCIAYTGQHNYPINVIGYT